MSYILTPLKCLLYDILGFVEGTNKLSLKSFGGLETSWNANDLKSISQFCKKTLRKKARHIKHRSCQHGSGILVIRSLDANKIYDKK